MEASLVVQWLRIQLQHKGHRFNPGTGKIPHVLPSKEAGVPQLLSPRDETTVHLEPVPP